jgi:uncharacterized protein (TIGR03437 family)
VDSAGNVYIADTNNQRVRKVTAGGTISTLAGNGGAGYSGDGGPAANAQLNYPMGVAVDCAGNLFVTEYNRVRKVTPGGTIWTAAGNGTAGYSGDGGLATSAQLNYPTGAAADSTGNLYIADTQNNRVRKVAPDGTISTVAGNGSPGSFGDRGPATSARISQPSAVAVDSAGNLYIADFSNSLIRKVTPGGIISTVVLAPASADCGVDVCAQLSQPEGVAVDSAGNLYIADTGNNRMLKMTPGGTVSTVAGNGAYGYSGDGGPATSAELDVPSGVAVDSAGNLYIADAQNHRIRKVASGKIWTVAGNGLPGYSGDGGPAARAQLAGPSGVAVDSAGNLYIADKGNSRIRKVTPGGTISTVAGNGVPGYSGDGGPAASAQLNSPSGIAVDAFGVLYIADSLNNRIRKVALDGTISTVAGTWTNGYSGDGGQAFYAQLAYPNGVALDSTGNLYIADSLNNRIRKVASNGIISTLAGGGSGDVGDGGPATGVQLNYPTGVAVDSAGSVYVADFLNNLIRKVAPNGTISTVAGNGAYGYSGDGGAATSALLNYPAGVAPDMAGKVYLADTYNNSIRVLTPIFCTYSAAPTALQVPVSGGSVTVSIQTSAACPWTVSGLPAWITVSGSTTGSGSAAITLAVAANSGTARSAQISVAGIAVAVSQVASVLLISTSGVVSAASYTAPVAPGSIAAIFGAFPLAAPVWGSGFPIPTSLGGLAFQFSGAPLAPLFYAGLGQVNAQVPWELAGRPQTAITAVTSSQTSTAQTVTLATYAPGIFAVNGAGTGQGAILDAANRLVDAAHPATAGSTVVQIFCTGLGPVVNQPATGAPSPRNPLAWTTAQPTVTIGGATARLQFYGLTPDAVGLYQVNAVVPQGVAKGSAVPVVISIGGVQSNTVTIAVQ